MLCLMFIAERVRDTLIHELCHAAVWLLHGKNDGHGPYWRIWYCSSNQSFQEQMAKKTLRTRLIAEQWCVTFPWNVNFCLAVYIMSFILLGLKKQIWLILKFLWSHVAIATAFLRNIPINVVNVDTG